MCIYYLVFHILLICYLYCKILFKFIFFLYDLNNSLHSNIMTIISHINYEIPNLYASSRYDTNCLHFAKLFRGNKPIGNWMPNSTHMHAEHNALRVLRNQKNRKNNRLTMVVLRFDRSLENLLMSRPCSRCIELLQNNCIRTVVYSNNLGALIKENTNQIIHKPSSMACNIPIYGRVVSFSKFKEMPPRTPICY